MAGMESGPSGVKNDDRSAICAKTTNYPKSLIIYGLWRVLFMLYQILLGNLQSASQSVIEC